MVLEKAGFNVGEINDCYDYMPLLEPIGELYFNGKGSLKHDVPEPFAVKHGQLMFLIPELKKLYPDSKFILVVRNGADNIENGFKWYETYCKEATGDHDDFRMNSWTWAHEIAVPHTDYMVVLEDLVKYPDTVITDLFKFLDIKKPSRDFRELIKRPDTIGRGIDREYADAKIKHWMRKVAA